MAQAAVFDLDDTLITCGRWGCGPRVPRQTFHVHRTLQAAGTPVAIISYNPLASLWVNCLGLRPYVACCVSNTGLSRAEALETLRLCKDSTITYFDDRLDNLEDVAEGHPDTVTVYVMYVIHCCCIPK